ncbi:MAG: ATP-binding cassette domain-containing protein [Actinobacteria bacterium]|uniref:Unannotated protein n=1 Tax=freshwater metagenome TaxID=449393 RepID=A0A6J6SVN3_9ZZZZ|nr:ATP-binding cassette domain-containing protein [Actinomycetota bacterium]MSY70277.1 ATP-binding cassette domain-containing protein [Actinomycetota bacterium]MTA76576.1 ATP-binding cassette domain-containing protein [Actinomycetota bacterium]
MNSSSVAGFEIKVNNVCKSFRTSKNEYLVLENVSFSVNSGEVLAICGLSGVGKSTLLRIIAGLTQTTSGGVEINGSPVTSPPDYLGFVTQDYSRSLFPWLTVAKNVGLPFRSSATSSSDKANRISEALAQVGLSDAANRYPWQLSGGMQQRVAIARALVVKPRLLLLDEPFASVDAHIRLELEDLVAHLVQQNNVTTILVTHDVDEAIYMADRVITLTNSPATVGMDLDIKLSRPRNQTTTREDAQFTKLRNNLYRGLRNITG